MAFDQRQLRSFLAVVDGGSLGRAAKAANMSQPAISRIIGDMETRLGQRLFDRHSKGVTPTVAGATLLPHARLLLFEMRQAAEALDALNGLRRGVVRIGSVATIARSILPAAVARLLDEAPGLRVELLERPDDQLHAALARREIDLMIVARMPEDDDIVPIAECAYDDVYAPFCSVSHPLAAKSSVTAANLLGERWIMPAAGATPRDLFCATMRAWCGSVPDVAVETGSLIAMIAFVAQSRLLGWLPRPLISSEVATGTVRLLDVPALAVKRRFFVYRRTRGALPSAAARFLDVLPLHGRRSDVAPSSRVLEKMA